MKISEKSETIICVLFGISLLLLLFGGMYYIPRHCDTINKFEVGDKVVVNEKLQGTVVEVYRNCSFKKNFKVDLESGSTNWYNAEILKEGDQS